MQDGRISLNGAKQNKENQNIVPCNEGKKQPEGGGGGGGGGEEG